MASLVYIHGFLSSPQSFKAQQTQQWLAEHRPGMYYHCPHLTPYPDQCFEQLTAVIESCTDETYLIGSSMGGFWAHVFAEKYALKAVLVNPAVDALTLMPAYLKQPLKGYHDDNTYELNDKHIRQLAHYEPQAITDKNKLWLLAQMGDETLNYQSGVEKFTGCRQTIEENGNHSFAGFERYLPEIIDFFEDSGD